MAERDAPRGTLCLFFAASHRRAPNLVRKVINKNLMSERMQLRAKPQREINVGLGGGRRSRALKAKSSASVCSRALEVVGQEDV